MAVQDVDGSLAWAKLCTRKDLSDEEDVQIAAGLALVKKEFSSGQFSFAGPWTQDIDTAVERRLTELIGATAGKLHTGRSRNDQVATDFRLWML